MRRLSVSLSMAAVLITTATLAMAQGPGGPGGPGGRRMGGFGMQGGMMGGGLMLLRMPEVQTELKMTQPQIAKIDEAQQTVREAMREVFQGGFQNMTQEERQKAMAKIEEIQNKAVASILDQTQLKRFKQLELQRAGAMALMRPAVAKELGLTEQQQAKLRELQQKQMEDMRALFQGGGFQNMTPEERQQLGQKMQEMRKKAEEAALGVLTAEQKAKWTEMIGKPFKFPEMGPGMFGGRRNRPGGAGGPGGNPPA